MRPSFGLYDWRLSSDTSEEAQEDGGERGGMCRECLTTSRDLRRAWRQRDGDVEVGTIRETCRWSEEESASLALSAGRVPSSMGDSTRVFTSDSSSVLSKLPMESSGSDPLSP